MKLYWQIREFIVVYFVCFKKLKYICKFFVFLSFISKENRLIQLKKIKLNQKKKIAS